MKLPYYGTPVADVDPDELAKLIEEAEVIVWDGLVFPAEIHPMTVKGSHPETTHGKLMRRLDGFVTRVMFWNSFRGRWGSDGDFFEAKREMAKVRTEAATVARKAFATGSVSLEHVRKYLAKTYNDDGKGCYELALPWTSIGGPEIPMPGRDTDVTLRTAMARINEAGEVGMSRSQIRLAIFNNNAGDLDGLVEGLLANGIVEARGNAGAKGGRPGMRYYAAEFAPNFGLSKEMLDPFHFKPEDPIDPNLYGD